MKIKFKVFKEKVKEIKKNSLREIKAEKEEVDDDSKEEIDEFFDGFEAKRKAPILNETKKDEEKLETKLEGVSPKTEENKEKTKSYFEKPDYFLKKEEKDDEDEEHTGNIRKDALHEMVHLVEKSEGLREKRNVRFEEDFSPSLGMNRPEKRGVQVFDEVEDLKDKKRSVKKYDNER